MWLAAYLIKVNAGLAAWGRRCLPTHQLAYLATMDLVRCASESCNAFAAHGLAQLLRPRMLHVAPRTCPTNHTHAHAWRMPMHGTRMQPSWRAAARSPGRLLGRSWATLMVRSPGAWPRNALGHGPTMSHAQPNPRSWRRREARPRLPIPQRSTRQAARAQRDAERRSGLRARLPLGGPA